MSDAAASPEEQPALPPAGWGQAGRPAAAAGLSFLLGAEPQPLAAIVSAVAHRPADSSQWQIELHARLGIGHVVLALSRDEAARLGREIADLTALDPQNPLGHYP